MPVTRSRSMVARAAQQKAVRAFQAKHKLDRSGVIDGATWDALDRYKPVSVTSTNKKGVTRATIARGGSRLTRTDQSVPAW